MRHYQIFFYVPASHLEMVKQAMFEAGAGSLANYSQCCWQTLGQGQYLPNQAAQPFLGEKNKLCHEAEYKVEMLCLAKDLQLTIEALKKSHPYEEPAYGVVALESLSNHL